MLQRFLFLLLISCVGFVPRGLFAQEFVFSTQTSNNRVGIRDQLQVNFVLQNAPGNVSDFKAPTFAGFRVVGGPSQSSQHNISIINGRTQESQTVQIAYLLQPTRQGNFKIDGATVKIGGQTYTSNPVSVQVVAGSVAEKQRRQSDPFGDDDPFGDNVSRAMQQQMRRMQQLAQQMQQQMGSGMPAGPQSAAGLSDMSEKDLHKNIFIKVTVDNTHPHVGEQITASYKLYTRLPMNMSLTQLPSLNGFWSEDFDIPNPPKPTIEKINGKEYQVFLLKKSALFPQHDGTLILDPAKAAGVVRVVEKTKGDNFFDDQGMGSLFMNDPVFNNGFFSRYQYRDVKTEISSQPIQINVLPLPKGNQPGSFAGAVGNFTITAKIDSTVVHTGSSANFTLTVQGSGNFKLIGNPQVNFPPSLSALDPIINDTITGRTPTIVGQKTFTYNLSPQQTGSYTIPSVEFSFYDPATQTYKTLKTKPIEIQVKKGTGISGSGGKNIAGDIHPIMTGKQQWNAAPGSVLHRFWYWLLYLLALGGFTTLLVLNKQKNEMEQNSVLWRNKKANKVAWKRLAKARKLLNDKDGHIPFYEEVSKAVWLYLSDKLNIPISELSKENITDKLNAAGTDSELIRETNELISECEMALYSPSGGQAQRDTTLEKAVQIIGKFETTFKKNKNNNSYAEA